MDGLTTIQENCLRIIRNYITTERRPPTRRELAKLTGQRSTNGINQILAALERKGCIKMEPRGRARNIVVLRVPTRQLSLLAEPEHESPGEARGRRNVTD